MAGFEAMELTAQRVSEEDLQPEEDTLSDLPRLAAGACPAPLQRHICSNCN